MVWLLLGAVCTVGGFATLAWQRRRVAPPRPNSGVVGRQPPRRHLRLSSTCWRTTPHVTAAALRATVIDLAARGWLRILPPGDEDELARIRPAAQGLRRRFPATTRTTRAAARRRSLHRRPRDSGEVSGRRHPRILVAKVQRTGGHASADTGLITRRWRLTDLVAPAVFTALGAGCWLLGVRSGADVAVIDSVERRIGSWLLLTAVVVLAITIVRVIVRPSYTHTNEGVAATKRWLALRVHLDQAGFGELAPSVQDIGDRRLAYAVAMCVAEGAAVELPLAREDHFRAWSSVGGRARLVRVTYPSRSVSAWRPTPRSPPGSSWWLPGFACGAGRTTWRVARASTGSTNSCPNRTG